jgi:hypothetical protein
LDNQPNRALEIRYEKIEGDIKNVFRYEMTLTPDQTLAVRIDDLAQQRHVRKESKVDEALIQQLVREIESSGFFALDAVYTGIQPDSYTLWDLTVIIDKRVHRCRVLNRVEPEKFKAVRERLETFGKNEIGLWAIQFSREKLIELAQDSAQLGRKRYDERGIQYGNLAGAIQSFREAEFYLETVDPKPDFYPDIVSGLQAAREELDRRYAEQRFRADRAINLQEWEAAARELRILCDLIPDREDERHKDANRKLLDVETRLKARK